LPRLKLTRPGLTGRHGPLKGCIESPTARL